MKAHGFDHWGLADVDLARAEAGLLQWLTAGFHGDMDYMARNPEMRVRPAALFPGARSALMVAASYRPEDPDCLARRWRQLERRREAAVSIYALGRDYHRLVRGRLQRLGEDMRAWFLAHPDLAPSVDAPSGDTVWAGPSPAQLPDAGRDTNAGRETNAGQDTDAERHPEAALHCEAQAFRFRAYCDSAPLLEVELARKALLGWRGKNTLLLHRDRGSLFFLGTLLSNLCPVQWSSPQAELPVHAAETGEHCGSCQACLQVCPTQAIVAPYRLDARRCIAYLTIEHHGPIPEEFRAPIGNRIYGCDDCQLICPWNKFAVSLKFPGLRARPGLVSLDLIEAISWDEEAFLRQTEGSPIRRIGYRRWLRNVAVALGNLLDTGAAPHRIPSAEMSAEDSSADTVYAGRALQVLEARRKNADPMVVEHIDWALRRLEAGIREARKRS